MNGFVFGNGESRLGLNLESFKQYGKTAGCNAIYKDFEPDILISVDRPMIYETLSNYSGTMYYWESGEFIRRPGWNQTSQLPTRHEFPGYSSGPSAIHFLLEEYPEIDKVFLIGFDLVSLTGRHNNVYKGHNNYRPADALPTSHVEWQKQMISVFKQYPNKLFYWVDSLVVLQESNLVNISRSQMFDTI
jgi:hypothetical protein